MRAAKTASVVFLTSLLAQPSHGIEFESFSLSSLGRAVGLGCGPGYHARPCTAHRAAYYNRVTACAQPFGQSDPSLACYDHTHPNRFWRFPVESEPFPSGHQPNSYEAISPYLTPLATGNGDARDATDSLTDGDENEDEDEPETILDKLENGRDIELPDPSYSDSALPDGGLRSFRSLGNDQGLMPTPKNEAEPIVPKRASPSPSDGAHRDYPPHRHRVQLQQQAMRNLHYATQARQADARQPAWVARPVIPVRPPASARTGSSSLQPWSTRQFGQPQRQPIIPQSASQNAKNLFWY